MTRRLIELLITLAPGFLVAPLGATAPPPPEVPGVVFLYAPRPLSLRDEEAFRHGLHTFGSVVGQHMAIEERSAPH
jgi:hypothetical protein